MPSPRAGDEVIAIDREVAYQLALIAKETEGPNVVLRRLLGLDPLTTVRASRWRRNTLNRYRARHAPVR